MLHLRSLVERYSVREVVVVLVIIRSAPGVALKANTELYKNTVQCFKNCKTVSLISYRTVPTRRIKLYLGTDFNFLKLNAGQIRCYHNGLIHIAKSDVVSFFDIHSNSLLVKRTGQAFVHIHTDLLG